MDGTAKLLTEPTNYAVVQLPGRKFPGVVFQGDSLHALVVQVTSALAAARKHADKDLNANLEDALELLSDVETRLRTVCDREGIAMPYPTPMS